MELLEGFQLIGSGTPPLEVNGSRFLWATENFVA